MSVRYFRTFENTRFRNSTRQPGKFSLEIDETRPMFGQKWQFLSYVRFAENNSIIEQFLSRTELSTTSSTVDGILYIVYMYNIVSAMVQEKPKNRRGKFVFPRTESTRAHRRLASLKVMFQYWNKIFRLYVRRIVVSYIRERSTTKPFSKLGFSNERAKGVGFRCDILGLRSVVTER